MPTCRDIYEFIDTNNIEQIETLITQPDTLCFSKPTKTLYPPLTYAIYKGKNEIVKNLLSRKDYFVSEVINFTGSFTCMTPLMVALQEFNYEIAKLLIQKNANINCVCENKTALSLALKELEVKSYIDEADHKKKLDKLNADNTKIISLLIEKEAKFVSTDAKIIKRGLTLSDKIKTHIISEIVKYIRENPYKIFSLVNNIEIIREVESKKIIEKNFNINFEIGDEGNEIIYNLNGLINAIHIFKAKYYLAKGSIYGRRKPDYGETNNNGVKKPLSLEIQSIISLYEDIEKNRKITLNQLYNLYITYIPKKGGGSNTKKNKRTRSKKKTRLNKNRKLKKNKKN